MYLAVKKLFRTNTSKTENKLFFFYFTGAILRNATLEGSQMSNVNLRLAILKGANMQNCVLRDAVLAGADLEVGSKNVHLVL